MTRTIVGVLRGGTSSEYDHSLKTGAAILSSLPEDRYETRDILIDKSGLWHLRGAPATPARALAQIDVVLSALHGGVGEDGTVHRILARSGVPFAGSRALPAALSQNKIRARQILKRAGIPMSRGAAFSLENDATTYEMAQLVFSQFSPPYLVKPPTEGGSHGIRIASTILELPDAIGDILDVYGAALVEEFLVGEELHTGVIEDFRGEELYTLPPAHFFRPADSRILEPSHRDSGGMRHAVPSNFTLEQKQAIADLARAAHRALNMAHFSSIDIILTKRGPHLLEVDSIPSLHQSSHFPKALEAVGSSVKEFLEHAIHLARR